jgi:hypothetical protein
MQFMSIVEAIEPGPGKPYTPFAPGKARRGVIFRPPFPITGSEDGHPRLRVTGRAHRRRRPGRSAEER